MNSNDRVLINTYLDNETSEEETKYVEGLIENNIKAFNYFNALKKANIEIDLFFDDLKTSITPKNKKGMLLAFLSNTLKKSYIGYATTAVLFFGLGTLVFNNDFIESNIEYKYLVLRSDADNEQLILIINDMINKNINLAKLNSDIYNTITVIPQKNSKCYFIELSGEVDSLGKYCVDSDDIYISDID